MSEQISQGPRGELAIRTVAMPADTNPRGDIFGGWLLAHMDIAGGITAQQCARGRAATVAVNAMTFKQPVYVGDVLCCYADIVKIGRSSMTIRVEAWVIRADPKTGAPHADRPPERVQVTEGVFTYVAIDEHGRPRPVPRSRDA
ncbi:MAG: acyl-CoA thioesterase [Alphaproteobacteria bacterium]|nr:acyl-CoA thioesterase [Alphaproteobacteria bacterium]